MRIDIKMLSVNQAWQGKRFKTVKYEAYTKELLLKLKPLKLPEPPFKLVMKVGFSNKLSDIDNILKPTIDIIQKKYGINDRDIYQIDVEKVIVEKGNEFFEWDLFTKNMSYE
jgi:Holliday junction resolvase RusA-like endonuclease